MQLQLRREEGRHTPAEVLQLDSDVESEANDD
jgi:hypothetical protein